jgi:hypothetical protein
MKSQKSRTIAYHNIRVSTNEFRTEMAITFLSIIIIYYLDSINSNTYLLRSLLLVHGVRSLLNLLKNAYRNGNKQKMIIASHDKKIQLDKFSKRLSSMEWDRTSYYSTIYWCCIVSSLPFILQDLGMSDLIIVLALFITTGFPIGALIYCIKMNGNLRRRGS